MRKYTYIFVLVCCFSSIKSQVQDTCFSNSKMHSPGLLSTILPGGTYFYKGDIKSGLCFAVAETGLLASGFIFDSQLKKYNESEYYNYPKNWGSQLYLIDKGSYFLNEVDIFYKSKNLDYNKNSLKEILKAPFDLDEIKHPLVLSMIGFGIIDAIISYSIGTKKINSINRVYSYGAEGNQYWGTALYTGTSALLSYGAGTSEEILFRGIVQPLLDYKLGKKKGLITSSLLFSAMHYKSFAKIDNPYKLMYSITEITSIGYIFGKHAQNNNYNLTTLVAAHAWFDFIVMMTSWVLNPEENPIGFSVSFKM